MKKGTIVAGIIGTLVLIGAVVGLFLFGQQKMIKESVNLFNAAKSLYEKESWPEAKHLFSEVVREYPRSDVAPESLYYAAVISQSEGKYAEALEKWRLRPQLEGDSRSVEVGYYIGLCLERLGKAEEATTQYEDIASNRVAKGYAALARAGLGRIAEKAGDLDKAYVHYEEAMAQAGTSGEARALAEKLLGELNLRVYYKPVENEYKKAYLIKSGDSMVAIAIRNNVTVDQLCRLNGISDPTRIRPNMRILIPNPDFSIHIDKSDFKLTLYNHDMFFKSYKVGLGKNGKTPEGEFEISDKIKNPTWWSPEGPVPPGDPNNELGTRWLALKPLTPGIGPDYGIHGTIDPSTIGWESSNGCPRMYPKDAEEFYTLVPLGTPVVIEP
jgi:LysM repeat protein/outer membrane protein assembly factor BamD (BamD/ComL family)